MLSKLFVAACLACGLAVCATASHAQPRVSVISQWSAGAEGDAMNQFGVMVTQAGATWEHHPVSGFTTDMMNKLRADIIAGRPPSASQLKGPEIQAWSAIAPTVDLDQWVAAADYEKTVPPELVKLHKVKGHWVALPLQIYRVNTLFASKVAMDKIGAKALPKTWEEFNAMAEKMVQAGITPIAQGGLAWADEMDLEVVLLGMSPDAYKRAFMDLDENTLAGPQVLAAFTQLRKMTGWMSPSNAGQHWSVFIPQLMKGEYGFLMMGGWASGVLKRGNFVEGKDYLCGSTPNSSGKPIFDMNADGLIFWKTSDPDYQAGQKITAQAAMSKEFNLKFSQINGSIPVRTDVDLAGAGYQDCQRDAEAGLHGAIAAKQLVMSLAHNMAQPNSITAAMRDVVTEFVHNKTITPEEGQKRLVEAVDSAR
jgi:glucose/mannose transport system substrate-binding protein